MKPLRNTLNIITRARQMPSPPRQGLRWWMRSTMLTSRGCRNAWSRARTHPLRAWNSRCKRHGAKGGDGTWCDSPWITEIGSSFTAILWAIQTAGLTALNFKTKVFLRQILPCTDKVTLFSSISPLRQLHFNVQYATIRKKK